MPGVPCGRGCDGCRRSKKKCDQSRPSCARCTRLNIPCVGGGKQRFKFLDTTQTDFQLDRVHTRRRIPWAPSNPTTLSTSRLITALNVSDARFDLSVYGLFFMREIPRRLGINPALDAAVRAMTTALPMIYSRQRSNEMYERFIQALKTLRVVLDNPAQAMTPETMCAMYCIGMCQEWLGRREDNFSSHSLALAHMLNAGAANGWHGAFEADLVISVLVNVLMDSWANPKIRLDRRLWDKPESFGPRPQGQVMSQFHSLRLRNFARLGELTRNHSYQLPDIRIMYEEVKEDCRGIKHVLADFASMPPPLSHPTQKGHIRYLVGGSILHVMAMILNAFLSAYDPLNECLREESLAYIDDVLDIVDQACPYRPLGTSCMPTSLIAAGAVAEDQSQKARINAALDDWKADFTSEKWEDMIRWCRAKLRRVQLEARGTNWKEVSAGSGSGSGSGNGSEIPGTSDAEVDEAYWDGPIDDADICYVL